MSSTPWEGIEQPIDEAIAGSPWFYIETYVIFQDGLISLLEELNNYVQIANELYKKKQSKKKQSKEIEGHFPYFQKEYARNGR